jgi:hypothetical protein
MKITLTESEFVDRFLAIRPDNFSREGLRALFDYLGELEREAEDETEFDPIGICCEWTEYGSAVEAAEAYGWEDDAEEGEERDSEPEEKALDFLLESTAVVPFSKGFLVANF